LIAVNFGAFFVNNSDGAELALDVGANDMNAFLGMLNAESENLSILSSHLRNGIKQ
jgi:hypothetical protein